MAHHPITGCKALQPASCPGRIPLTTGVSPMFSVASHAPLQRGMGVSPIFSVIRLLAVLCRGLLLFGFVEVNAALFDGEPLADAVLRR